MDDEGYPVQPYGLKENNSSILDIADIVYLDPVNCGFSRAVSKDIPPSTFFGVNEDIKYLAEWISTFVTRYNRWASPKFMIGESYGTTRAAGLARCRSALLERTGAAEVVQMPMRSWCWRADRMLPKAPGNN